MTNSLSTAKAVIQALQIKGNPQKAQNSTRFFKTGPGQYGAGDIFWGITVPEQRHIAQQASLLPYSELEKLLASPVHEQRLTALHILVNRYKKSSEVERKKIFQFYKRAVPHINNWDLVDTSASTIIGEYLFNQPSEKKLLSTFIVSPLLWKRRIAIIATLAFIRRNDFTNTLQLSQQLFTDKEDLMHKAAGWMLREVGKRDRAVLANFLTEHASQMPRTMLRYAIEHFSSPERKRFLHL